jgi:predicted nucleic acid-binding protein
MISLPDVNVWIALAAEGHVHHRPALHWFVAQPDASIAFCRVTQMALLRLIDKSIGHGARAEDRRPSLGNFHKASGR